MIIQIKNKNTLIFDDFIFKCCIGIKGSNSKKKEGDFSTPKGLFKLKELYYRKDRVGIPECRLKKKLLLKILHGVMIQKIKIIIKKLFVLIKNTKKNFTEKTLYTIF